MVINWPSQWKRKLLFSVVHSQLWSGTISAVARTKSNLIKAQRANALRVIHAYRTVSDEATQLLVGMPPVDLLASERTRVKIKIADPPLWGLPLPLEDQSHRTEVHHLGTRTPGPTGSS